MHHSWALEPFVKGGRGACPISTTSRSHMQIWEETGLLHDEGLGYTLIERLVSSVVQRKGLTPYVLVLVCIVHGAYYS